MSLQVQVKKNHSEWPRNANLHGNMMLDDKELNMLATLRMNHEFMKLMQEHFDQMSLDNLKKLVDNMEGDIKNLSEQQFNNMMATEDINNAICVANNSHSN